MVHRDNNLASLLRLTATSARPFLVRDPLTGRTRFPSGSEAIAGLNTLATDGRYSDPLLVERFVRFVDENRVVGFADPLGIYIKDVQHHELAQPDGSDVPAEWIDLSRGRPGDAFGDGRPRWQRLRFEVPTDADFEVSDLVVRRTGEPLLYAGQLAELTQLALYLRTSTAAGHPEIGPADPLHRPRECAAETASWDEFERVGNTG
jgi:hypothetical protein